MLIARAIRDDGSAWAGICLASGATQRFRGLDTFPAGLLAYCGSIGDKIAVLCGD
jgi:hypothetical protein